MTNLSGTLENGVHTFPVRVYYEDTDAGGIVYYARYLQYAERARTELLRTLGGVQSEMMEHHGIAFAVRHVEADYRKPARLDDLLTITTKVVEVRKASLKMVQDIALDGQTYVAIKVRLACISLAGGPARIPDDVMQLFDQQGE